MQLLIEFLIDDLKDKDYTKLPSRLLEISNILCIDEDTLAYNIGVSSSTLDEIIYGDLVLSYKDYLLLTINIIKLLRKKIKEYR